MPNFIRTVARSNEGGEGEMKRGNRRGEEGRGGGDGRQRLLVRVVVDAACIMSLPPR